ncbi:serine-rich adhesin for platelets-like [Mercenaria mercenaria]|uniref:serine-rich adhesin for platelets-like n=1 Tax=Mercenaria mercenaria TaxID=6596 RepID=UPI00234E5629|nr:serine-rich adhesin for platelets-like [Mercenaria mercenaria]
MNFNFIYVLGLCISITDAAVSEEWSQWTIVDTHGGTCLRLRTRHCAETSVNCTDKEFSPLCPDPPHWEEWSPLQCTVHVQNGKACIIARTRNCSVPTIKDCQSNEKDRVIQVWGDMKTCPCREGATVTTNQGNQGTGQWGDWSGWQCQKTGENCYIFRTRQCSVPDTKNCPPSGSSQLKLWEDACPCGTGTTTTKSPLPTTSGVSNHFNTSTNVTSWLEWGAWDCHNVDFGCMQSRWRHCSNSQIGCKGAHYELALCNQKSCTGHLNTGSSLGHVSSTESSIKPSWSEWGPWECHKEQITCVSYRHRNCSSGTEIDCEKNSTKAYEMSGCDVSCANSLVKTTTTELPDASATSVPAFVTSTQTSIISAVTKTSLAAFGPSSVSPLFTKSPAPQTSPTAALSTVLPTSPTAALSTVLPTSPTAALSTAPQTSPTAALSTVLPTSPPTAAPIYWLEWTGWDCQETLGLCLMKNLRNCSTYNPDDCEDKLGGTHYQVHQCRKEICPANWLAWGEWKCKMGYYGACNMTRTRECSTGISDVCGPKSSETSPCEKQVCPDKFDLHQSGRCKGFNKTSCTDAVSCSIITYMQQLICQFKDTAFKDCPKACGCCEDEPHWSEWSDWECNRFPNNTCRMTRTRKCSAANTNDCKGMSELIAACSDSICPELNALIENCKEFNASSMRCVDFPGCSLFEPYSDAIKDVCSEPGELVNCPILCGCCVAPTSTTDIPTGTGGTTDSPTGTGGTTNSPTGTGGTHSNITGTGGTHSNASGTDSTTISPTGIGGTHSITTATGSSTNIPTGTGGTHSYTSGTGSTIISPTGTGGTHNNTSGTGSTTISPTGTGGTHSITTGPGSTTNIPTGTGGTHSYTSGTGSTIISPTGTGGTHNNTSGTGSTTISPTGTGGTHSITTGPGSTTNIPTGTGGTHSYTSGPGSTTNIPTGTGGTHSYTTGPGSTTNIPTGTGGTHSYTSGPGSTTNIPTGTGGTHSYTTGPGSTTNIPTGTGGTHSYTTGPGSTTNIPTGTGGTHSNTTGTDSITNSPTGTGGTHSNTSGTGVATTSPSGTGGTYSNTTGSGVTTTSPSGTGGTHSNTTGTGVTTTSPSGTGGTHSNTSGTGVTTTSPSGTGGTHSNTTGTGITTTSQTGTGGTHSNTTGSDITTTSPTDTGGTHSNTTGSGNTTNSPTDIGSTTNSTPGTSVISNSTPGTNDTSHNANATNTGNNIATTLLTTTPVPVKTTTHKPPYTIPPRPTTCKVCSGPLFLCEKLYVDKTCDAPNNYCINKLSNHKDGTRTITRDCGSFDTCYRDWFLGSSDSDKCRNFEDNNIITLDFDCTYCCIEDGCNESIRPSDKTLYKDL